MNAILTDKRYCPYKGIPSMTPDFVHYYLKSLGASSIGQGCVVELGCWLGATTRALLDGLAESQYRLPYHAFDRWLAISDQLPKAEAQGVPLTLHQDLSPLFQKNVSSPFVFMHQGEIGGSLHHYPGGPIKICLFDAPKEDPLFTWCMNILRPHFIPGVTVLGLLDYYFFKDHPTRPELRAPVSYMEKNHRAFEKMIEWPERCSCAFFRYLG